ncbi:MAG: hypothetical protein RL220_309 [Bacteroidota bacterium]
MNGNTKRGFSWRFLRIIFLLGIHLLLSTVKNVSAQDELPEINIFDGSTNFCDGILYDSGGPDDTYSGNENITFTIESPGIIDISFFGEFCLESGFDYITIYDGPDTSSPVLGSFTGTSLPPSLSSTGNYLTFQMTTDPSASYCGFALIWNSTVPPPVPPALSSTPLPLCGSNTLTLNLSSPLDCDIVEASVFEIIEPLGISVVQTTVNCNQGLTITANLELSSPFDQNCEFEILWSVSIPDACDSIHDFEILYSFLYDQCPLTIEISAIPDTICTGSATELLASVQGCLNYTYSWNEGVPPGPGPHAVSPDQNTSYTVTVTELETGLTGTASIDIVLVSAEILTPPQQLCATASPIILSSSQQGTWSGPGITDPVNGWFDPSAAVTGFNEIIFSFLGCNDTLLLEILPIDAGPPSSTCPGSQIMSLSGAPSGGTWSGVGINSDGTFDPVAEGSYTFFYSLNGCTDSTLVEVANISVTSIPDTVCQSESDFDLLISPQYGTWSGTGIVQSDPGVFSPAGATAGDNVLTYSISGCAESWNIHVLPIEIGGNFHTACPDEDPLFWYNGSPEPAGGIWTGDGIIDPVSGLFDPSLFPENTYTWIAYDAPNGCSDTMTIHVISTYITLTSIDLCIDSDIVPLNETTTGNGPSQNGQWLGTGINVINDEWIFDPQITGPGNFLIYYEKNNCLDSIPVNIIDPTIPTFTSSYCQNFGTVELPVFEETGLWSGTGVNDDDVPVFITQQAIPGDNILTWTSYNGCSDSVVVFIEEFQQSEIMLQDDTICYSSVPVTIDVYPSGGQWSGDISGDTFTPSAYGEGTFSVIYSYSGNFCSSSDTAEVTILEPIIADVVVSDSILCPGQASSISVNAYGGNPANDYDYLWSDPNLTGPFQTIQPPSSQTISLAITDGCSDTLWFQTFLEVLPSFSIDLIVSDTLCFGEDGFLEASVNNQGTYEFSWDNGETSGQSLMAPAGTAHELMVTDSENDCIQDTVVLIPAWSPLTASFSVNPNMECIPFDVSGNISIIDFSNNALSGWWSLGNGTYSPYSPTENVDISYNESGYYTITLIVENEGGCTDTASKNICILPPTPVFIPDIFSPNGDGNNDFLFVRSQGIISFDFRVFNRWGEEVFQTSDIGKGWDGYHRGMPCQQGSYAYFIRANLNDGQEYENKGEIVLIR